MKPTWIIGIIAVAIIATLVIFAVMFGYIQIPGLAIGGLDIDDEDAPPGAVYCDYTDMQILDMLETVSGKDLDNSAGISFVRALNMKACGSNDETDSSIATYYKSLYSDWYLSDEATDTGSGWTAHRIVWLNDPDSSSATLSRAVLIGEGVTVKIAYGYDTITIVSDGPVATYGAFMIWVASS